MGEEDLILRYFKDDYTYEDICKFLHLWHGINLTMDQLRKRLKRMGLRRRDKNGQTSFEEVEAAIKVSCVSMKVVHSHTPFSTAV